MDKNKIVKYLPQIIIFALTFIIIWAYMVISPQYPLVYGQSNQNVYCLVGKLIKNGKVPFVDIADHKGVYVFLIHCFAEMICEYKHIGLFVVGLIFIYVSALYIYKIVVILNSKTNINKITLNTIAILSSISYVLAQSIYIFSNSSLQSETFINTTIIIAIYYFIYDIYIAENNFSSKHTVIYGIIFAFIFYIKANYDLLFLEFCVYMFIKMFKNKSDILKHLKSGILGIFIGLLPGTLYLLYTKSFFAMLHDTFVVNAIYSNSPYFGLDSKLDSIIYTLKSYGPYFTYLIAGMIVAKFLVKYVYKEKELSKVYSQIIYIMLLILVSIMASARDYSHYLVVSLEFIPIILSTMLVSICIGLQKFRVKHIQVAYTSFVTILCVVLMIKIGNVYGRDKLLENGKEQLQVAQFVENTYKRELSHLKNQEFFVLGQEFYIYNYLNILPDFKYFILPIVEMKYYPDPYEATLEYIKSAKPFVVAVGIGNAVNELWKYTEMSKYLDANYKLVAYGYGRSILRRK